MSQHPVVTDGDRLCLYFQVLWSTAQILSTVSWNLAIEYPRPFSDMMSAVAFSQLDFSAIDCYVTNIDLINRVYYASLVPLAFVLIDVLVGNDDELMSS